jgi:hypothetical protein
MQMSVADATLRVIDIQFYNKLYLMLTHMAIFTLFTLKHVHFVKCVCTIIKTLLQLLLHVHHFTY